MQHGDSFMMNGVKWYVTDAPDEWYICVSADKVRMPLKDEDGTDKTFAKTLYEWRESKVPSEVKWKCFSLHDYGYRGYDIVHQTVTRELSTDIALPNYEFVQKNYDIMKEVANEFGAVYTITPWTTTGFVTVVNIQTGNIASIRAEIPKSWIPIMMFERESLERYLGSAAGAQEPTFSSACSLFITLADAINKGEDVSFLYHGCENIGYLIIGDIRYAFDNTGKCVAVYSPPNE